jgi:formate hydrogenlyase subunit 4
VTDAFFAAGLALLQTAGLLAAAPLLKTVIKKMKARLQNRQGPPLLQGYSDLAKLLGKASTSPRPSPPRPWFPC